MAEYKGSSQEGARHQKLEKAREKMMADFEQQRIQISKDHEVKAAADKFVVQHDNVEEALKKSTIGLVHLKEFRKVRQELEEQKKREAAQTNQIQDRVVKKKTKKVISKLSFDEEEEEAEAQDDEKPDLKGKKRAQDNDDDSNNNNNNNSDDKSSSSPTSETAPIVKKSKFGKDPNIDTSFLPDREREEEERRVREQLRQEWLTKQQLIKNESIQITYSYWDGSGHRKEVECKKGDTIAQFLEKCRQQFQQLRGVSIDNMMYVKEDLIIPHHYTFYDFIINKARGKSGPLFSFDVHEDIRLTNDAGVEKDESHAGKVVERSYYERNKHIFPLSRFEIYDPEKSYGKYSIKGNAK
ncbi:MAG: XAP5, circadian clock regulator-domain-containing protein [Linnemannia gamsii]|nr:MAG: XAP5, circadian clock regulator-domain-containing protein [Linnemannia gamsii]